MKKHEIDWLAQKLNEHLGVVGGSFSLDDTLYFAERLPSNLLFEGLAYRAKFNENNSQELKNNLCWSKNIEGVDNYLKNHFYDMGKQDYNLYQADIIGIDVNKLINYLEDNSYDIKKAYLNEEEILAIDISNWTSLS